MGSGSSKAEVKKIDHGVRDATIKPQSRRISLPDDPRESSENAPKLAEVKVEKKKQQQLPKIIDHTVIHDLA